MNVRHLRARIADFPDDAEVVVSGSDHSFTRIEEARLLVAEALIREATLPPLLLEYAGDENKSDQASPLVRVVWLS